MKILESICPAEKLAPTLTELYEGGGDAKFILPSHVNRIGDVVRYLILYSMPES